MTDQRYPLHVEKRYRELARERRPDNGGSQEAMARLNQARDVLLVRGRKS